MGRDSDQTTLDEYADVEPSNSSPRVSVPRSMAINSLWWLLSPLATTDPIGPILIGVVANLITEWIRAR